MTATDLTIKTRWFDETRCVHVYTVCQPSTGREVTVEMSSFEIASAIGSSEDVVLGEAAKAFLVAGTVRHQWADGGGDHAEDNACVACGKPRGDARSATEDCAHAFADGSIEFIWRPTQEENQEEGEPYFDPEDVEAACGEGGPGFDTEVVGTGRWVVPAELKPNHFGCDWSQLKGDEKMNQIAKSKGVFERSPHGAPIVKLEVDTNTLAMKAWYEDGYGYERDGVRPKPGHTLLEMMASHGRSTGSFIDQIMRDALSASRPPSFFGNHKPPEHFNCSSSRPAVTHGKWIVGDAVKSMPPLGYNNWSEVANVMHPRQVAELNNQRVPTRSPQEAPIQRALTVDWRLRNTWTGTRGRTGSTQETGPMAEHVKFPECNFTFTAPPSMGDGCSDLPVFRTEEQVISCWQPDRQELAEILRTGRIWLHVVGQEQPLVAVSGWRPFQTPEVGPAADPSRIGGTVRHKGGGKYLVVGACTLEFSGTELVVYRSLEIPSKTWARPRAEFCDGRFTPCGA